MSEDHSQHSPGRTEEILAREPPGQDLTRADSATNGLDRLPPPPPRLVPDLPLPAAVPDAARPNFGGYEVLGELGRGGMGVVYRAWDERLKRVVALKLIQPGAAADPQALARFRTEAEAVARLRHPNIVQIHEVSEASPCPYCVLEYVDGGSLAERIAGMPQPAEASAALVAILARAVQAAHDAGIVHRDLKPANVLLCRKASAGKSECRNPKSETNPNHPNPNDPNRKASAIRDTGFGMVSDSGVRISDWEPKVTDFGLAKLAGGAAAGQTQSGAILGTPSYMAPEQAAGRARDVGPAADVYGLGAILYELLTGRPPFRGETATDTLLQVLTGDPVPPSRLRPGLPRDLEVVCLKCLEKEPGRRYRTAAALAEELGRFLAREPIQARPLSAPARLWRWCRRKPALATASGLAAVALVAVIVLSIGFGIFQSRAATKLREALGDAENHRRSAQRLSAGLALDRGIALCEQGEIARGLLWLTRSLEIATAAGAEDLEPAIRANLAAWRTCLFSLQASLDHSNAVFSAAFSPDGKLVLTGDAVEKARLWDARAAVPVGTPIKASPGPSDAPVLVAFKPDGSAFLTAGFRSGKVRFWDTKTRQVIGPTIEYPGGVFGVAFSPDGKLLLTSGQDGRARMWDADSHQPVGKLLAPGKGDMAGAFSPDGKTFVTGCADGTVLFWDTHSRQVSGRSLVQRGQVTAVAFRPDGKVLLTGSTDGFARLWEVATGRLLREVQVARGHPPRVAALAFSPDGMTFLSGDHHHHARLWDTASGAPLGALQHGGTVRAVAFSPDGRTVLTASNDMTARLWKAPRGARAGTVLLHPHHVSAVAFSPDGRLLATGCRDSVARLWEAGSGRHVRDLTGHRGWVRGVAFSPDSRLLATVSFDRTARLWNLETGGPQRLAWEFPGVLFNVDFSPDGHSLLIGGRYAAQQLGTGAGKERGPLLQHRHLVNGVAFSPDGRLLATGSADRTARLWAAGSGTLRLRLQHPAVVSTVAFSPDGQTLLTGCEDHLARFWDVASARLVGQPLSHGGWVQGVAFGRDGQLVATCGGITARIWDAASRRPLGPPLQHESFVMAVACSPDGSTLVTGSDDRTARLWPVPVPLGQGVEQLVAWVQVVTGLELDADGVVHELDDAAWKQRRQRLVELGGPPA
jgi:WD40 repeat protein/serine/threonine protein kinase